MNAMAAVERKIVLDENTARIEHDTRVIDVKRFEDIEKVFVVHLSELIPSDEEAICVITFASTYWVMPSISPGSAPFFEALLKEIKERDMVIKQCEINQMPWGWRVRLWGFLPLFPDADLGAHTMSSLPKWQECDVISLEEFIESIQ